MVEDSFGLAQQVFKAEHSLIRVDVYHESSLTFSVLNAFLATITDSAIGIAPSYGPKCIIDTIAFSTTTHILVIKLSKARQSKKKSIQTARNLLHDLILCDPKRTKYAFQMDRLAAALHFDLDLRINQAVDLLSAKRTSTDRHSLAGLLEVLRCESNLNKAQVTALFKGGEASDTPTRITATQAWAAYQASHLDSMSKRLGRIAKINTDTIGETVLGVLAKTARDANRLITLKPTRVKNEVDGTFNRSKANVELVIEIQTSCKGKVTTLVGQSKRINGRAATIVLKNPLLDGKICSVTTIGREVMTSAETMREDVILKSLQELGTVPLPPVPIDFSSAKTLNRSQVFAVNAILSNNDTNRITLIHGPPGTGKTTIIAAAVTSFMISSSHDHTLWLVAQSNVAVKNIAEKLAIVDFFDFKILVSKDFHFDYSRHEHLYEKIMKNPIRSDDPVDDLVATGRLLLGSRVILSTLMAPYGQSYVEDLRSIFEISHLRKRAVFLDTQYRMPVPIANFISRNVYTNRLKTEHPIKALTSCVFVNVPTGKEEKKGHSWMNVRGVSTALALVRKFNKYGKSYRIITAYDGNEDDYIILSLVRTGNLGFMKEHRRMNVMLTRCKKGIIILTNRTLIEGKASSSLVGSLAKSLGPKAWVESGQVPRSNFYPFPN
ncbi:P-loop containing nucleoside triphosphate hydrolase protein [Collybia nuda]|uniref:P-loop containing nucleoside triphosphate hydrolase protein n=1 Tax=Collybia nuda TaxID=64659 RepID=A0A9P5XW44_9AGAR|nr:P-loop containing nucleoside triphosphate hydrolase protein [Collybia nuda]